jgi:hypothetical protein
MCIASRCTPPRRMTSPIGRMPDKVCPDRSPGNVNSLLPTKPLLLLTNYYYNCSPMRTKKSCGEIVDEGAMTQCVEPPRLHASKPTCCRNWPLICAISGLTSSRIEMPIGELCNMWRSAWKIQSPIKSPDHQAP